MRMVDAADFLRAAEELPVLELEALFPPRDGAEGVLVLAPHPDDESLGCGGLLAQLAAAGRPVRVVVISDGAASHPNSRSHPPERLRALRQAETVAALRELGLGPEHLVFLGLPDGAVPHDGPGFEAAVAAIANLARRDPAPAAILSTWGLDPHPDHVATAAMAEAVARELATRLFFYPVWGWRHLYPAIGPLPPRQLPGPPRGGQLPIEEQLPAKQRAVAAHRSQTTRLIDDDPEGFMLSPEVLSVLLRPTEIFLEATP
ncbi:PIG-L deacetylase family protein [Roseomonas sp. BN140053]|uniref:PIG-L deacetylase family protein n=1 Tax=Roseomonas sp. BN140053 TaxID=3391898 RepID=UPI0039EA6CDA